MVTTSNTISIKEVLQETNITSHICASQGSIRTTRVVGMLKTVVADINSSTVVEAPRLGLSVNNEKSERYWMEGT